MSQELQTQNTALAKANERIIKLCNQYDSAYTTKPGPTSLEAIADNRHRLATLDDIAVHRGSGVLLTLVVDCVTHILEQHVHVKRAMDETMIAACAELICRRHPVMTPADIKLFMTKGVCGEYGPILDRVDSALIMSWASQYWEQMKALIRSRRKDSEWYDPKVPVPKEIEELSEKLRIKETTKRTQAVLAAEKRKTMAEEYAERGWDLDEEMKNRK